MAVLTNSGLAMAMESAIASPVTITGITKANPGVVTAAAHGYSDGDVILVECEGMIELNDCLFVVMNKTTDTFQLENPAGTAGIDTTNYNTFTSGTAKKLTLGITLSGVQDFSPQGGDITFQDITTVHDKTKKQIVNGANPMSYNLTMQWDPADTAQAAMIAAYKTGANKGFKITWPSGRFVMFYGTVGYTGMPGGASQGVTTSPAAIAMNGSVTVGTN